MNLLTIKNLDDLGLLNDENTIITHINLLAMAAENYDNWYSDIAATTFQVFVELLINHQGNRNDWKNKSPLHRACMDAIDDMWRFGNNYQKVKELIYEKAEDKGQYRDFNDWYGRLESVDIIWNTLGDDWGNWLNHLKNTPYEKLDNEEFETFFENNFGYKYNSMTGARFELCYNDN